MKLTSLRKKSKAMATVRRSDDHIANLFGLSITCGSDHLIANSLNVTDCCRSDDHIANLFGLSITCGSDHLIANIFGLAR